MDATTARMMPSSTPRTTTAPVVTRATVNSCQVKRRIRRISLTLMSWTTIRKTTAARAAVGKYASGPVRSKRTTRTTAEALSWASWLRPPAWSTICALVGLPLTTNVPVTAAAALAAPRPTRSVASLKSSSSYFAA